MPSLSQWPSAKVVSVNREWGFVVLQPDTLTVAQGEVAYFEGVPRSEAWVQIVSADDRHLMADLNGSDTSQLGPGDRVLFSQQSVRMSSHPSGELSEVNWTDPTTGAFMD
jgi:hypothetical protein